jgi:1,4-dihydroxy-6-naphthoate synthase
MKLTIGFSPCPNDTFIFEALVNKKIDTEGLDFDIVMEDVETLNQWALQGKLNISKISYGVLPLLTNHYDLLDPGGALGKGVGPLLISNSTHNKSGKPLEECLVAIPGKNTTAHLLFSLAFPGARNKQFMGFSAIEDAILTGRVDCGVIIHENRFTYEQKGLVKLADLGEFWEKQTGYPIPLGGIVIQKNIESGIGKITAALIRQSIAYAYGKYPVLPEFVKNNSQEMEEKVMRQHIDLYVNNYSVSLGKDGRQAIQKLISIYSGLNGIDPAPSVHFIS